MAAIRTGEYQVGSFRGAEFRIAQDKEPSAEIGRRNVLHEYPQRDIPYAEDLGRAARRFDIDAFVMTGADMDVLLGACEEPGPGRLVHPWFGSHLVQLDGRAKVSAPGVEGGTWGFTATFVEAGENTEPDASVDTAASLLGAADLLESALDLSFADGWIDEVMGLAARASGLVGQLCSWVEQFLGPIERAGFALQLLLQPIIGLINQPKALASLWQTRIAGLLTITDNPFSGRTPWKGLLDGSGSQTALLLPATESRGGRLPLPEMTPGMAAHVRGTAIVEAARVLPEIDLPGREELLDVRDFLLEAIAAEQATASHAVYEAYAELRLAIINEVWSRLPTLPEVSRIAIRQTEPALVICYRVLGDLAMYDDMVARNRIRHPGFVPAGKMIEVLHG